MSEETLERIARIVDTLAPLGEAGAGEPVRAAEWNSIVGGVVELARIALARERTIDESLAADYATRGHDHIGGLDLRWFEPGTRQFIETGGGSRPDLEAELKSLRRDLDRLTENIASIGADVGGIRRRLDEIAERDDDRKRNVDDLAGRIEVFGDQERRIVEVATMFGTIDERVAEALALRDEIAEVGDLGLLRRDLDELQGLRENLRGADGTPFELRDFERRLAVVERRRPNGTSFDPELLRAEILAEVATLADERVAPIGEGLADLRAGFGGLTEVLDGHEVVVEAMRGDVAVHAQQLTAVQAAVAGVPELTERTNTLETRTLRHETDLGRLTPLLSRMDAADSALDEMRPLIGRLGDVEGRVAVTEESIADLPAMRQRITGLERLGPDVGILGLRVEEALSSAAQAAAVAGAAAERLTVVESQADDAVRSLTRLQTETRATRETVSLLSVDFERFRIEGPVGPG